MKKYLTKHIGKEFKTKQGLTYIVVDGANKQGRVMVKCNETPQLGIIDVSFNSLKEGGYDNPYHTTVCGVGYRGVGPIRRKTHKKIYDTWRDMLKRCYNYNYSGSGQYHKATVCDEWHCLQNFGSWMLENYIDGYDFDKDMLQPNTEFKIYSPSTCKFIDPKINQSIGSNGSDSDNRYGCEYNDSLGVHKSKGRITASISVNRKLKHLGEFKTEEEAHMAFVEAKVGVLLNKYGDVDKVVEVLNKLKYPKEIIEKLLTPHQM